jgi:hypothetical protein
MKGNRPKNNFVKIIMVTYLQIDTLLGNDSETNKEKAANARHQPANKWTG